MLNHIGSVTTLYNNMYFYLEEMSVEAEALDSTFYFILFVLSLTAAVAGQLIINHRQGIYLDILFLYTLKIKDYYLYIIHRLNRIY